MRENAVNFVGKDILQTAHRDGVAVCGFDAFNMESAQAVVCAANALSTPVFLQAGLDSANHMGFGMALRVLMEAKQHAAVAVCVHLDHGRQTSDVAQLKDAIALGFESVMVDGSGLPLAENIRLCRQIVDLAHASGICVEAELGRVSRDPHATPEELERLMTDPDEAARFVEESGVDYLAVSVGSISGFLGERPTVRLDLERLKRIAHNVPQPLVFHGGTGIPADQLRDAVKLGVSKINVAHGFRKSFLDGISSYLCAHRDASDPRVALAEGRKAAERFARVKIEQARPIEDPLEG